MVKLVYEDWISKGKKARVVDSFKTDHGYILLELLKHKDGYFIGISRNMAYPDMESWISCYTVASDDAYDIFNYIKDNVTDGTWWELTNLMKKSGFKYKLQSILNCTDREMNPNYVTRKNESMKRNRYRGLDTVDESIGESYRANRIGLKESFNSALDNI